MDDMSSKVSFLQGLVFGGEFIKSVNNLVSW